MTASVPIGLICFEPEVVHAEPAGHVSFLDRGLPAGPLPWGSARSCRERRRSFSSTRFLYLVLRMICGARAREVPADGGEEPQPHASVPPDFTRALFTSNWGRAVTGEVDAWMIVLPQDGVETFELIA
jgi:hypothetical protein